MPKVVEETKQGTHVQGDPFNFSWFQKVGASLMASHLESSCIHYGYVGLVVFHFKCFEFS